MTAGFSTTHAYPLGNTENNITEYFVSGLVSNALHNYIKSCPSQGIEGHQRIVVVKQPEFQALCLSSKLAKEVILNS